MSNNIELLITCAILVLELALIAFCFYKSKQPPNPLKPRLVNYQLIILFLVLFALATLAHIISLVTGTQVQPRRRRGM
ncbi:MAG: hypothetical protein CMM25_06615 [Rhodospirillaceae bacterium]|nr:hypothetical protein [Rhodospirillaceae bacterium]